MRLALVAVAALAVVANACGGVENDPSLAKAAERTEATGSWRFEMRGVEPTSGEEATFACDGAADHARSRMRFTCDYEGTGDFTWLIIDDTLYSKIDLRQIGGADTWERSADSSADEVLGVFTPEKLLALLRTASRKTERLGEEGVRGQPTVKYRLTVNCEDAQLACETTTTVEVWVGDDGLVRRVALEDASGDATLEFFDFGADVEIEAPPADQVGKPGRVPLLECDAEDGAPIGVDQALATFRKHGFRVKRDAETCLGSIVAQLSNGNADEREEGWLSCMVLSKRADGVGVTTGHSTIGGSGPVREPLNRRVANLDCALSVEGARAKEIEQRFQAALDELTGEVGG